MNLIREITPLTEHDCFTIFPRVSKKVEVPLHHHESLELNLIINGGGAKRTIGDHTGDIENLELVLLGSNLAHGWSNHKCKSTDIREVTLQFHKDLFEEKLLKRNQLLSIGNLLEQSKKGILFPKETIERISPRLLKLSDQDGFAALLEFLSILHDLSISSGYKILSNPMVKEDSNSYSRRIEKVIDYMNAHYSVEVSLNEVAKLAGMPDASFSRFIKTRTGYTFIDSLNEIRLRHVTRMLIDTQEPISDIASKCGFNNLANFNRTFKSKNGCTPKEFRENYKEKRLFV
ncbi:MAG: AraC family transcriptional regulator [Pedobacter sp.]